MQITESSMSMSSAFQSQKIERFTEHEELISLPEKKMDDRFEHQRPEEVQLQKENSELFDKFLKFEHLRLNLLKVLVEEITGMKIDTLKEQMDGKLEDPLEEDQNAAAEQEQRPVQQYAYQAEQTILQQESLNFTTEAVVHTADGRAARVGINLEMNRTFIQSTQVNFLAAGDLLDGGKTALPFEEVDGQQFEFSLQSEEGLEQIGLIAMDGGFLGIDANRNGMIENNERLGQQGLAQLAQMDEDGNGWIDSGDRVFEQLSLQMADGSVVSLRDRGIGAIATAYANTPFSSALSANQPNATLRSSGMFLSEDLMPGLMQHIDVAV